MLRRAATACACAVFAAGLTAGASTRTRAVQAARDVVTAEQIEKAIDSLGAFEFPQRMAAARTVRRAAAGAAIPALRRAVSSHADQFVRFRALVILSGFNDPRTREVMLAALDDRNDRMRSVAYSWFERNPDQTLLSRLIQALDREESEFVRPALTRAVVAYAGEPKAREARDAVASLTMKGQDLFRAAVIEALGEYKAAYALKPIVEVAKLDGPLQDDAVTAIGRVGDKRGLETLAALQRTAPRTLQPTIAGAICLLGSNCASHQSYITETLVFAIANPGFQELLRSAASALAVLGIAGNAEAIDVLIARGTPTRDPARAAIALALGNVALRNTGLLLDVLQAREDPSGGVELLREAFDMLEEDFEEERFFATVRRTYWQAAEGSPSRRVTELLIQKLEF